MWFTTKMSRPRGTMEVMKHLSPTISVFLVVSGWHVCFHDNNTKDIPKVKPRRQRRGDRQWQIIPWPYDIRSQHIHTCNMNYELSIYIIQLLHADSISLTPPRARHQTLRTLLWRKLVTLMSACSGRNYNFRRINVVFWRVFARDSAPGG